jgi:outer membrane protein insertion porin family
MYLLSSIKKLLLFQSALVVGRLRILIISLLYTIISLTIAIPQNLQHVNDVSIVGNKSITTKTLLKYLNIKKSRWLRRSEFNTRALKLDMISIKNQYIIEGYLDVAVTYAIIQKEDSWVNMQYNIIEGDRYIVNRITINGNVLFSKEQLLKEFEQKINQHYNPIIISKFISEIEYKYFSMGKILTSVSADVIKEDNFVAINLNIEESNTYSIGDITITGLNKYRERYIQRELAIFTGDIYDVRKIEKSQKRIFSTGLFTAVEIIPIINVSRTDFVNLEIKVREYSTRQINTDIGVGQEPSSLGEGAPPATVFELETKWQPGTLFNSAGRLEISGNLGIRLDESISSPDFKYEINWFNPWLFNLRIPLRLKYFHDEISNDKIDAFESSFIYKTGENYNLSGSINLEFIERNNDTNAESGVTDEKRSIQITYIGNELDNFIIPSTGKYYTVTTELNGSILGGEHHYIKFDTQYKKFYPLRNSIVGGYQIKAGYLHVLKKEMNNRDLPSFYKYKLGGSTSLRGWQTTDGINEDGGLIRLQSNFDIRFQIYKLIGGEVFFDAGKLANEFDNKIFDDWNWDVGFGITFLTPIGPTRLDTAFPYAEWSNPTVSLAILYLF